MNQVSTKKPGKSKKLTRQEHILKVSMAGMAHREEKRLAQKVRVRPTDVSGLSARELQNMRNAEYFRRLNAGEIQEPPMPTLMARLVIRDDVLGEPI